jgi:hypothetical protein
MEKETRSEKRPRIKTAPKNKVLCSSDRPKTDELIAFFAANVFKKKDPFMS